MSIEDRRQLHQAQYQLQQSRAEIANLTTQCDTLERDGKKLIADFSRALGDAGTRVGDGIIAQTRRARLDLDSRTDEVAKLTRALTRIRDDFLTATHSREVAKEALAE